MNGTILKINLDNRDIKNSMMNFILNENSPYLKPYFNIHRI